jgi:hypothetical protein
MGTVNAIIASVLLAGAASADATLVMVEQSGCIYCGRWDAEIAPTWPKTDEGRRAPLRRVNLHDLPDDIDFRSKPRLTPTFLVVIDGVERARIEGYMGDEFFWHRVGGILEEAGVPALPADDDGG